MSFGNQCEVKTAAFPLVWTEWAAASVQLTIANSQLSKRCPFNVNINTDCTEIDNDSEKKSYYYVNVLALKLV